MISYYVKERLIDNDTGSETYETKGMMLKISLLLQSPVKTNLYDAFNNLVGDITESIIKYLNSNGDVEHIETATMENRYHTGKETLVLTSADGEGVVSSRQEWIDNPNFGGAIQDWMNKGSLYYKHSGELIASAEHRREYDRVLHRFERILTNQDGTVLATEVSEPNTEGGTTTKTQYFTEDTGKLRKTVDEITSFKGGKYITDTTTTNAAGVVVEKKNDIDGETTTVQRMDSITGKLKSTITYGNDVDTAGNNFYFEKIADADGKLLSHYTNTILPDEVEGTGTLTNIHVKCNYDTETGKVAEEKTYKTFKDTDKDGNDIISRRVYGTDGKLQSVETRTYFYEIKGGVKENTGIDLEHFEYEGGKETLTGRLERRDMYDEEDTFIGYTEVEYSADGTIISEYRYEDTYDAYKNEIGKITNATHYNKDGTVDFTTRETYDKKKETTVYEKWNAKGRLLYKSTDVTKQYPFYIGSPDVDSPDPDRAYNEKRYENTITEEEYSEYTGNLMTTTITKTTSANTGDITVNMVREKASGVLAGTSHLSYMYVQNYGYLNHHNYYSEYLYRATGELKYIIDGAYLLDNYYLNKYLDKSVWWIYPSENYTEHLETKTTADGILAEDYHWKRSFRENALNEIWYDEYTSETKVYDEKTGDLKSVETTTQVFDELTGTTVLHTLVHNAAGDLIGEYTSSNIDYMNALTPDRFLGENSVAYNDDGQTIKTYSDDGSGTIEETNITHDTNGAVIKEERTTKNADGSYNTEVTTYDANGAPVRKSVKSKTMQDENGSYTETNTVYDGNGKIVSTENAKAVYDADGNETYYREDKTDNAGNAVYKEVVGDKTTETFYEGDQKRTRVEEGNKVSVYAGDKLLSTTTIEDNGESCTKDADGNVISYTKIDDNGDLNEYFADGKVKTAIARDDDDELRITSFDEDGYINYVKIEHPDKPYTMVYDGDGKVSEILYEDGDGRTAYYDATTYTWYSGTGADKVAIAVPEFASEIDMSDIETGGRKRPVEPVIPRGTWYPDNTACTFGIHLRDIEPALTEKWYTVTPIDLSQDGIQSYELVAGNMYIIGQVNVAVNGDEVIVDYKLIREGVGKTKVSKEYMNIFSDLNSITLEALEGDVLEGQGYEFGQPISIAKDLGGDTNVLLYVRNVATFNTRVYDDQFLVRMWPNTPARKEIREGMINLVKMDTPEVVFSTGK